MTCCKPAGPFARFRGRMTMILWLIFVCLVMMPLRSYSWRRDNNGPSLAPESDYRLQWIPDADFRALETTDQPQVTSTDGRTTYVAGETWQVFRPYYTTTPDGQWHVMVLARGPLSPYGLRAVCAVAVPAAALTLVGLGICLFTRPTDHIEKKVAETLDPLA